MAYFKNYDPGKVVMTWKGILITGYATGTFIDAEREVDAFSKDVGASGDTTRVRNRNRSGMVTVRLQAASPCNDLLSAQAIVDESSGLGYGPIMIRDLNGTTLLTSAYAWIRKVPKNDFGDEAGVREWIFDCADLTVETGGALV